VPELRRGCALELRNNSLRQHLAQFHSPLIEGVNIPHRTLSKYVVLVQRHKRSESARCKLLYQDCVGWPIAFAHPEGSLEVRRPFGLELFSGFAEGKSFGLSEHIGR